MMNELRFATYAIKKNIQSSAELRTSFLASVIGMTINNSAFIVIWVFFIESVGVINGWTAKDIFALQGFCALSYGIVFSVGSGLRSLPDSVTGGGFDRFILSPKNLLVRLSTSSFNASAVGDIVFGVICLVIYGLLSHLDITQVALLLLLIIISVVVMLSLTIAAYSMSFFFTDASSVATSAFEMFLTPSLFHGGAFQGATRLVFTFIIPSLVLGALPTEIVRDVSLDQLAIVCLIAILWLVISIKLFYLGVKRYESTNLMTFGN